MTATETSAITWGETQVAYTIRRSARRKKTVAVTVDPTGGVLLVAPEHFATSRLDAVVRRKAAWIVQRLRRVPVPRPAAVAARVRQRRERALSRPALSPEGPSERVRGREAARRLAPRARAGGSAADGPRASRPSSRGSAVTRRSGCRSGWKRGGRRPASRCPPSSSRTSRNGGGAVTEPEPSA